MIVIIDYGLGNLASVANALKKLEIPYKISSDPIVLKKAKALILPGDGAAGKTMENLKKKSFDKVIKEFVNEGKPFLGICIGMQVLLSSSQENKTTCLDIIDGQVKKLDTPLKIPQIGWNNVKIKSNTSRLMKKIPDESYFYFINSYICIPDENNLVTGVTNYDTDFCSVFEKENIFGVQFHPEKSGNAGLQLLQNFWEVACK